MEWDKIIIITLASVGFLFGFYKWVISRNDKRKGDLKTTHSDILTAQEERLNRHNKRLEKQEQMAALARADIHQILPRLKRIEKLEESIPVEMEKLHVRIGGMARDLNQAIGAMKANHENEISDLIKEMARAIKEAKE